MTHSTWPPLWKNSMSIQCWCDLNFKVPICQKMQLIWLQQRSKMQNWDLVNNDVTGVKCVDGWDNEALFWLCDVWLSLCISHASEQMTSPSFFIMIPWKRHSWPHTTWHSLKGLAEFVAVGHFLYRTEMENLLTNYWIRFCTENPWFSVSYGASIQMQIDTQISSPTDHSSSESRLYYPLASEKINDGSFREECVRRFQSWSARIALLWA